jgi:hypothetical protein
MYDRELRDFPPYHLTVLIEPHDVRQYPSNEASLRVYVCTKQVQPHQPKFALLLRSVETVLHLGIQKPPVQDLMLLLE